MLDGVCENLKDELAADEHALLIRFQLDPMRNSVPVDADDELRGVVGLQPRTLMDDGAA